MSALLPAGAQSAYERLAECAWATNTPAMALIDGTGIVAVPDVVLIECEAQGEHAPETFRLRRWDGRETAFYVVAITDVVVAR